MRLRRAADQFWPVRVVAGVLGAAADAATSGILGALTEAGLSKEDAHSYAEGVRRGGTLVSTRVPDGDRVRPGAVLNRSAVNLRDRTAAWQKSGWKTFDPASKPYGAGLDFPIRIANLRQSMHRQVLSFSPLTEDLKSWRRVALNVG